MKTGFHFLLAHIYNCNIMKGMAHRVWGHALDIIFPPLCLRCKSYLKVNTDKNHLLCRACFLNIPIYEIVAYNPGLTLAAISSYENEALRKLLYAFKYNHFLGVDAAIHTLIKRYLSGIDLAKNLPHDTIIIPIPLHKKRMRQRGFNQAERISNILGSLLGFPILKNTLIRIKDTPPQARQKSKKERFDSLRGSFSVTENSDGLKGKTVILVDDIYTSGATMNEATKVLRRVGTKSIIGFVIAKTN